MRSLTFQFALANRKLYPDNWTVSLCRFPEATSLALATSFNKASVMLFSNIITKYQQKENLQQISSGIATKRESQQCSVPPKIIAPKGIKEIGQMTSGERGQNVTNIAANSAAYTARWGVPQDGLQTFHLERQSSRDN